MPVFILCLAAFFSAPGHAETRNLLAEPYAALYDGLDNKSAALWRSAVPELAGNPKGRSLLDDFAKNGITLPRILVKNIPDSDLDYRYGKRELVIGKDFLARNGLRPGDLKEPANRERLFDAVSPIVFHELIHARSEARFPRRHAANAVFFDREKQAYWEEMIFIHYKKERDPAWATSEGAPEEMMTSYEAFLEGPEGYFASVHHKPSYINVPTLEQLRESLQDAVRNAPPGGYFPGIKEDLESLEKERDYLKKDAEPAMMLEYQQIKRKEAKTR